MSFAGNWRTATAHIITVVVGGGVLSLGWAMAQVCTSAHTLCPLVFIKLDDLAFSILSWMIPTSTMPRLPGWDFLSKYVSYSSAPAIPYWRAFISDVKMRCLSSFTKFVPSSADWLGLWSHLHDCLLSYNMLLCQSSGRSVPRWGSCYRCNSPWRCQVESMHRLHTIVASILLVWRLLSCIKPVYTSSSIDCPEAFGKQNCKPNSTYI